MSRKKKSTLRSLSKRADGVGRNIVIAYVWHSFPAAQGNEAAKRNLDAYKAQLTPAQRAEGQRLISNLR